MLDDKRLCVVLIYASFLDYLTPVFVFPIASASDVGFFNGIYRYFLYLLGGVQLGESTA